jgi:Galactose oxidase, central domain
MHLGRWGAVLVLGLAPGEALSSPFWSETGSMKEARSNHTATLLASGSVLVVGGSNLAGILSSAELYDPATGAWTLTGALVEARQQHSATLLPSGKVLVAGGWNEDGPLVSAELYDPGTGTWRLTGSLAAIRLAQTATLLASGGVLVAGGATTAGPSASSEVYDPETGTWAATGSMVTPHMYHTATLLPSGKVLVAGGLTDSTGLPGSELYDPLTGMWNATGPMATSHIYHSATLLPSGKVLVSAGEGADNPVLSNNILASAELYDPGTGTWQLTGSMATAREYHTATLLPSGMALISGGTGNGDNFLASAERYDPGTGTWSSAGSLATPRLNPTMTLLASGKVLVSGGVGADDSKPHLITILRTAEVYDPSATGGCSATGGSPLPLLAMVPLSLLGRRRSPSSGSSTRRRALTRPRRAALHRGRGAGTRRCRRSGGSRSPRPRRPAGSAVRATVPARRSGHSRPFGFPRALLSRATRVEPGRAHRVLLAGDPAWLARRHGSDGVPAPARRRAEAARRLPGSASGDRLDLTAAIGTAERGWESRA